MRGSRMPLWVYYMAAAYLAAFLAGYIIGFVVDGWPDD
jgi:hypothetical protein